MKTLLKQTLLLPALLLAFNLQSAAQSVDMERMSRDIKIMENILQELFKTKDESQHFKFISIGGDGIRGSYIPEYGVIFTVPHRSNNYIFLGGDYDEDEDEKSAFSFAYSSGSNKTHITEESVINRISEFLGDYASTIGQLSSDDRVTVIYNNKPSRQRIITLRIGHDDESTREIQPLSAITVTAEMSGLQAYRSGDITQKEFSQQLQISKTKAGDDGPVDLKVMSTIFKTALDEGEEKAFRVSGSVDYMHLDHFGAIFSFDVEYAKKGGFWGMNIDALNSQLVVLKREMEQLKIEMKNMDIPDIPSMQDSSNIDDEMEDLKEREKELTARRAEVRKAYRKFKERLKQYLVDYGRTLSSVGQDQYILVSVNIHTPVDEVPERIDLQLEKSVLAQMDEGGISREEVMSEIRVREY